MSLSQVPRESNGSGWRCSSTSLRSANAFLTRFGGLVAVRYSQSALFSVFGCVHPTGWQEKKKKRNHLALQFETPSEWLADILLSGHDFGDFFCGREAALTRARFKSASSLFFSSALTVVVPQLILHLFCAPLLGFYFGSILFFVFFLVWLTNSSLYCERTVCQSRQIYSSRAFLCFLSLVLFFRWAIFGAQPTPITFLKYAAAQSFPPCAAVVEMQTRRC